VFAQLKQFLATPSVIQKLQPNKPIYVYLSVSEGGRVEVSDNRKGSPGTNKNNIENESIFPKSHSYREKQLPHLKNFVKT